MVKNISHRPEAFKIDRIFRIFFKILPKPHNKIIHSPCCHASGVSPADFQQLASGKRLAPIGDKKLQKLDFLFGEANFSVSAMGDRCFKIDMVAAEHIGLH